ncbi:MAG: DUF4198 domain-containing protein [Paracoccaceae bacterium]
MFRAIAPALTLLCLSSATYAHEFWIEPQNYQIEKGAPLVADLKNGQKFKGASLAFFDRRIERFELFQGGDATPVEGRLGDIPALQGTAGDDGLLVVIHQTAPSKISYKEWEKFQAFADHKNFGEMRTRHEALGFPTDKFKETYTRYAKALIAVGDGAGADVTTGMETEFVALSNPYTDNLTEGMVVQILYQGAPRADAQIEIFERAQDDTVIITTVLADAEGRALVPVLPGHSYLLDAVVLREAPKGGDTVWETLWAALTFSVPD